LNKLFKKYEKTTNVFNFLRSILFSQAYTQIANLTSTEHIGAVSFTSGSKLYFKKLGKTGHVNLMK